MAIINNKLEIGNEFRRKLKITESLMNNFGDLASDYSLIHTDKKYALKNGFDNRVSYGNILGLLISGLVGDTLKDYEVMLVSQAINFNKPIYINTTVELIALVNEINEVFQIIKLKLVFKDDSGLKCASGNCMVKKING